MLALMKHHKECHKSTVCVWMRGGMRVPGVIVFIYLNQLQPCVLRRGYDDHTHTFMVCFL